MWTLYKMQSILTVVGENVNIQCNTIILYHTKTTFDDGL